MYEKNIAYYLSNSNLNYFLKSYNKEKFDIFNLDIFNSSILHQVDNFFDFNLVLNFMIDENVVLAYDNLFSENVFKTKPINVVNFIINKELVNISKSLDEMNKHISDKKNLIISENFKNLFNINSFVSTLNRFDIVLGTNLSKECKENLFKKLEKYPEIKKLLLFEKIENNLLVNTIQRNVNKI